MNELYRYDIETHAGNARRLNREVIIAKTLGDKSLAQLYRTDRDMFMSEARRIKREMLAGDQ